MCGTTLNVASKNTLVADCSCWSCLSEANISADPGRVHQRWRVYGKTCHRQVPHSDCCGRWRQHRWATTVAAAVPDDDVCIVLSSSANDTCSAASPAERLTSLKICRKGASSSSALRFKLALSCRRWISDDASTCSICGCCTACT